MSDKMFAFLVLAWAVALFLFMTHTAGACTPGCRISEDGLSVIKRFEGFMPYTYYDLAGHPTIGFGHKIKPGEKFEEPFLGYPAHAQLVKDAAEAERAVKRQIWVSTQQGQYDALVSWTFNLGEKYLSKSELRQLANMRLHDKVPNQIRRWVFVGKTKYQGLVIRREVEAKMYEAATQ